jgi:hypothetical protein
MRTKASLVLNLDCETRKTKTKHDMCKTLIREDFIARKKQKQNKVGKKMYPKLLLNN